MSARGRLGGHELARALFNPTRVALVGASSDPSKNTGRPQRFLKQHGFRGEVFPINPGRDEVQGARAYARITDVPAAIDHALIMVPRERVPAAIEDCGAHGVPVATIYSDGFADLGNAEGQALQRALLEVAQMCGVRLVGPNSMGVFNFADGLCLSVNAILEMPTIAAGRVSVVSQSGSILGSLLSRGAARGIGFAKMLSVGNEADIQVGEVLDMLCADADTDAVLLFLESLRGAPSLAAAARRAHEMAKPVVAYKLGRSDLGRALAATHSGAMTGDAQVADAFFRSHGIARVTQFETLLEIAPLLHGGAAERARRVSVMTTTGGGAATVVDRLGEAAIETIPASSGLSRSLACDGIDVAGNAIIDLTMAGARRAIFERTLDALLADSRADAVVVVVGSSAQFHPQLTVEPIVAAASRAPTRALAVYIVPDAPDSLRLLRDAGIAAFRTPEGCADAVRALIEWRAPLPTVGECLHDAGAVKAALADGQRDGFNEAEAARVFAVIGIPVAPFAVVRSGDALTDLDFPVALKMLSKTVGHKTDVGGVVLDINDARSLEAAMAHLRDALEQQGLASDSNKFLVQSMQHGLAEAVLAFRRDPEVGPLVSIGLGGRLTEIYRDISVRLAPVSLDSAYEMIEEVKGLATIRGYRGLPRGDVDALARAVVAMSRLSSVGAPRIEEAEINPLLIRADGAGVVAVDALLTLSSARD